MRTVTAQAATITALQSKVEQQVACASYRFRGNRLSEMSWKAVLSVTCVVGCGALGELPS